MCLSKEQPVTSNTGKAQTMQSQTMAANNVTYCFPKKLKMTQPFALDYYLLAQALGP